MKNVVKELRNYPIYLGMMFLAFGFVACSDDDEGTIEPEPTGIFLDVEEQQTLSGNTLTVGSIEVGQTSWLVAVKSGDENTNNFISDPVMLQEGTNTDVQIELNEGAITDDGSGQQIVLKLYADNPSGGTNGEWDETDEPITDGNDVLMTETITVFAEDNGTATFADFDENGDGSLDANEVPNTYANNFSEWDADSDGSLNQDEFYGTAFSNTDADDDDAINQDEWNSGWGGMFGNYAGEDDFATFDADGDGSLNSEEWNTGFGDSEWFETYDADDDSAVTETEWDTGLFGDWDANDDDMIDEDEYNNYSPYVQNW